MAIRVYNTLTGTKEEFVPRDAGKVGIYVCGVTPYSDTHVGHSRPSIVWQVIRNYLRYKGYEVTMVQNFTDIDDKIIARAAETGEEPLKLAEKFMHEYLASMDRLGIERADIYPRVSEHISDIIEVIQGLVNKGHAYVSDGDVYYDVNSFEEYGKLSHRSLEDMQAGARVEINEKKRNPMDFALWKSAKPGEPAWNSPWGKGRPGWHIECSAMSLKYLGPGFDFHGGGSDLIFPHHENEIAQSEGYLDGRQFVRYWLHNGMINLKAEKMSKSLGNVVTIRSVLDRYPAGLIRFHTLTTHYRSPLEFDPGLIDESRKGWERLNESAAALKELLEKEDANKNGVESGIETEEERRFMRAIADARQKFEEAMDDDFNTALAIGALFELAREANAFRSALSNRKGKDAAEIPSSSLQLIREAYRTFEELGSGVLTVIDLEARDQSTGFGAESQHMINGLLEILMDVRQQARAKKDWATADAIRNRLSDLGVIIEDTPTGSKWKVRSGM